MSEAQNQVRCYYKSCIYNTNLVCDKQIITISPSNSCLDKVLKDEK